jgi:radical SAM superfamily enzyme YgiQ (UPF0313 family)
MVSKTGNTDKTLFLIAPPQRGLLEGFASGLISLANFVQLHEPGTDIRLLDYSQAAPSDVESELLREFATAGETLIGITATTASYYNAIQVALACKRLRPGAAVILGGHHATAQDDVILRHHPEVDVVVRGEGEWALLHLLRSYPHLSAVPSISFRSPFGIHRTPAAPLLETSLLDELSPVFQSERLHAPPGKFDHATYVSARGCPLRCAFCCVGNNRIRAKSIPAIIADLRYLIGSQGYRRLAIEDNFFAHSASRTIELCSALKKLQQEHSFSWDCQTRVESLRDGKVVSSMERAGCEAVYIGIESLTPKGLTYLGKTAQPDRYLHVLTHDVLPRLMRSSMRAYINLQFGLPGGPSDEAESLRTLSGIAGIAAAAGKHITIFPQLHVVYPGTSHFRMYLEQGLLGKHGHGIFEAFTVWEAAQEPILTWLGEHFAHGVGGIPVGILAPAELRKGRFEIDAEAVRRIDGYLRTIGAMRGMIAFRYGQYWSRTR